MITWSRKGWLALVLPLTIILIIGGIADLGFPTDPAATERRHCIIHAIGSFLGAAILWWLGRWMNRGEIHTIDSGSGRKEIHTFSNGHTLFYISMQYWAILWIVVGVFKIREVL